MSIYLSLYFFFFLPQMPSRVISYYCAVYLCFGSLPALVFLTVFHCEFLSAINSSAQPLADCSSRKVLFFFFLFFFFSISLSLLLVYLSWEFLKWTLTSKITSSLTFSRPLVLSQFNRVLQLMFPTAQKHQGRRAVSLK